MCTSSRSTTCTPDPDQPFLRRHPAPGQPPSRAPVGARGTRPAPRPHRPRELGAAFHLLAAGVNIVLVSKRLGHSSVAITSDTDTHLLPGVGSEAAARAWSLPPRGADSSPAVREQSVSNSPKDEHHRDDPNGIAAVQRLEDGAAYRNRTDDLRITSASLWPTELRRRAPARWRHGGDTVAARGSSVQSPTLRAARAVGRGLARQQVGVDRVVDAGAAPSVCGVPVADIGEQHPGVQLLGQ